MKPTLTTSFLTLISFASGQLTFNLTQALAPGKCEKYQCLTNEIWLSRVPRCLHQCQINASKRDGCAFDDFACHCVNYQVFSDLIEPCAFPPSLGGHGTCTLDELSAVRPLVQDMCNFFNATLYTDYVGCRQKLSVAKTIGIAHSEKVIVTY